MGAGAGGWAGWWAGWATTRPRTAGTSWPAPTPRRPAPGCARSWTFSPGREILRLAAWEELDAGQIAVVLGCGSRAGVMRLHRARRRLRDEIDRIRLTPPTPGRPRDPHASAGTPEYMSATGHGTPVRTRGQPSRSRIVGLRLDHVRRRPAVQAPQPCLTNSTCSARPIRAGPRSTFRRRPAGPPRRAPADRTARPGSSPVPGAARPAAVQSHRRGRRTGRRPRRRARRSRGAARRRRGRLSRAAQGQSRPVMEPRDERRRAAGSPA